MNDFVDRFVSPFRNTLLWRWPEVRISTKITLGKVDGPEGGHIAKDPTKRFLQIFVHLPDSYCEEELRWTENATPIPQACIHVLCALGLGVITTDAFVLPGQRCFTFRTEISERVYKLLPPPQKHLTNAEYYDVFE